MGEKFDEFISLDIPEEMYLSRNIQSTAAHAAVAGASPEETAKAVLAIVAGNVVEIEERLIALERQAGTAPKKPRLFL
jgi:hypothetical protein